MQAGLDFVQVGRATIIDPDLVSKLQASTLRRSNCDHCNPRVATMEATGVYCVANVKGPMR
jgi:2,4-dienoyl-CoA reductase-like NADH-dependent reductase (Old Yellow Enzyme family)